MPLAESRYVPRVPRPLVIRTEYSSRVIAMAEDYRTRCKRLYPAFQRVASQKFAEKSSRSQIIHKPISAATIARQTAVSGDVGIALRPAQDDTIAEGSEKMNSAPATSVRSELHPITKRLLAELELIPEDDVAKLEYDEVFWLKRKFDELATSFSSFIEKKRSKAARQIVRQLPPAFSSASLDMEWLLSFGQVTAAEVNYLFHLFRAHSNYPTLQYWKRDHFNDALIPRFLSDGCQEVMFELFRDKFFLQMGLNVITHNSFIPTVAGMSRGSLQDRCQLLTHVFTCWHLGHLLPEFSHLAREGQSVTIPYVTKERVRHVIIALQQTRRLFVIQDCKRLQRPAVDSDIECHEGEDHEDLFSLGMRKQCVQLPATASLCRDKSADVMDSSEEGLPCLRNVPSHYSVEFDQNGDVEKLPPDCRCAHINGRHVFLFGDTSTQHSAKLKAEIDRALEELFPRKVASERPRTPNSCASVEFCERLLLLAKEHLQEPFWKELLDGFGTFSYFHDLVIDTMEADLVQPARHWTTSVRKEGFLDKNSFRGPFERWKAHWCAVGGGFFWYYDCDEPVPTLLNPERVVCLNRALVTVLNDNSNKQNCFMINAPNYERKFSVSSKAELYEWVHAINSNMTVAPGKGRFRTSFTASREGISARAFVDGKETFKAMYEALASAQEEVFITSWFLSPELYLLRENDAGEVFLDEKSRLDTLLQTLAKRGVRVFVLPWSETKIVMDLGSARAKEHLEGLHENIFVLLHPLVSPVKWSHHQKIVVVDQEIAFVGGLDLAFGRYDDSSHHLRDDAAHSAYNASLESAMPRWPGKDYYNPSVRPFEGAAEPWHDSVDRFIEPRMGWHDVHMSVDGLAARDVAYNFIQRWNHHKEVLLAPERYPYLLPKLSGQQTNGTARCQVLRSISDWSGGLGLLHEASIESAYLKAISEAEHFIYVENQYFISSLAGNEVSNDVAKCILERVSRAIEEEQEFRVVVVLPVHPEGNLRDPDPQQQDQSIRYVMKWQAATLCAGENSLFGTLRSRFPGTNLSSYISFNSLAGNVQFEDAFCMEQIYVHSKLLIVDDHIVIMGSANINDRSMVGTRDSEICILVENDLERRESHMRGHPVSVSAFAHDLRVKLWAEHLGFGPDDDWQPLRDPLLAYRLWAETAVNNSMVYNSVFPDRNIAQVAPSDFAREQLEQVKGHLILYDMSYLEKEADKFAGGVTMTDDVYV